MQTVAFLRRNLQISQQHIKSNAYAKLVRPQLEYAALVCYPYTKQKQHQLEMVQSRAARYVCNNYNPEASVTEMLNQLGWRSLLQRRADIRLTYLYKTKTRCYESRHRPQTIEQSLSSLSPNGLSWSLQNPNNTYAKVISRTQ